MTKPNLAQLRRLVGNPDAYAVQHKDGSWHPERKPLTNVVLHRHLSQQETIGTYIGHNSSDSGTVAHTLVFDIDSGEAARAEADSIIEALGQLGIPRTSAGLEFSGGKGYHVWVPLQLWRPNAELRRVGRAVLAMASVECEVYPKQDEVRDLGNLVKLPGGVHQKTGNANDFEGPVPTPLPDARWQEVLDKLPAEQKARRAAPAESRFPCMGHIQGGVSEGGRNNQLFHLATMYRRAGVSDDLVDLAVRTVNQRCEPPLDDAELEQLLESSRMSGPICDQLPGDVREACGEYCMKQIRKGLHLWPGDVRNGGVGECVVVRIAARDANTVTFEHDDLRSAKGAIR